MTGRQDADGQTMACIMQVPPLIRCFVSTDLKNAYALLAANGWSHRIESQDDLARLTEASQTVMVAVAGEQIIGFARAITDGLSNGYLSMVVVSPDHRGQGTGRRLVEAVMGTNEGITWVLRASRSQAPQFFARLGFEPSQDAMERKRRSLVCRGTT